MKCPFCGSDDTQVKDSRPAEENSAIRRRRACNHCGQRFTTFERIQLRELTVIKSSGSREPLDREKLARSMRIALRKRPVDPERVELVVNGRGQSRKPTCRPTSMRCCARWRSSVNVDDKLETPSVDDGHEDDEPARLTD